MNIREEYIDNYPTMQHANMTTSRDSSGPQEHDFVAECEREYPTLTEAFRSIQAEQYKLFCRKHMDYGISNIAVGTTLERKEDRDLSLSGLWFRINDKIQRLRNLLFNRNNTQQPMNESIDDSLFDLSIYGIIALLVKSDKWKRG